MNKKEFKEKFNELMNFISSRRFLMEEYYELLLKEEEHEEKMWNESAGNDDRYNVYDQEYACADIPIISLAENYCITMSGDGDDHYSEYMKQFYLTLDEFWDIEKNVYEMKEQLVLEKLTEDKEDESDVGL